MDDDKEFVVVDVLWMSLEMVGAIEDCCCKRISVDVR